MILPAYRAQHQNILENYYPLAIGYKARPGILDHFLTFIQKEAMQGNSELIPLLRDE